MANKFTAAARKAVTISPLMEGREKLDNSELVAAGEPVTIDAFDLTHDANGEMYGIYTVKEYPDRFIFGGMVLTGIFNDWVKDYDGDCERASAELAAEGGVKMILSQRPTRDGKRTVTVPTFID
jgi:hypothetical protein